MKTRLLLFLCLINSTLALSQFAVINTTSSAIATTSATVQGDVLINCAAGANYSLQYSTTSTFTTSSTIPFTGNANITRVVNLTGLTPGTTYYWRFVGSYNSGCNTTQTVSPNNSFITLPTKPTIAVGAVTGTYNSATSNYAINPNGFATTSFVRYGTSSTSMSSQITTFSGSGTTLNNRFVNIPGLLANTQYFYQYEATNSQGVTQSAVNTFTTLPQTPGIYTVTASPITGTSATINYALWDKELATTSVIKYGLTSSNLSSQVTGFSVSGNQTITGNAVITGLTAGTTYFYKVEATNAAGSEMSIVYSFTTTTPPSLIAEYNFDNTYNNINGNTPFANIPSTTSFVADRNSVVNNAIQVNGDASNGTFCNAAAPTGVNARTISFWYKTPSHAGSKSLFSYGTATQYQTFGAYFGANGNIVLQGFSYDYDFGGSYALNTWRHLVITFNGADAKLYMNGTLVGTISRPLLNTGIGTNFRIGNNSIAMQFDDLKIYNYALSQAEVTSLFTNNTLTSQNFNQNNVQVSLYPNPATDVLNIEMPNTLKSVEIYNLQGQKVKTSTLKQTNVSDLAAGIYMVRVHDENNGIATQKIVKQ